MNAGAPIAATVVLLVGWQGRPPPARIAALVRRSRRSRAAMLVAAVGVVVALLDGPALGAAVVVAALVVRQWRRRSLRRRRAESVARHLADVIELLTAAAEAGCTLAVSIPMLAPLAPEPYGAALAAVARRMRGGERVADALGVLTDRLGPALDPLVAALASCERNGLPLAPTLRRLAVEARHDRRRRAEAAARALPVRLSFPLAVCLLPAFVLLGIVPALAPGVRALRLSGPAPPAVPSSPRSSP